MEQARCFVLSPPYSTTKSKECQPSYAAVRSALSVSSSARQAHEGLAQRNERRVPRSEELWLVGETPRLRGPKQKGQRDTSRVEPEAVA